MNKLAFHFASWNMIVAFFISWGIWVLLDMTAFKWGLLDTSDGFLITCIFTISSFIRLYFTNLIQLYYINHPDGKIRKIIDGIGFYATESMIRVGRFLYGS